MYDLASDVCLGSGRINLTPQYLILGVGGRRISTYDESLLFIETYTKYNSLC